MDAKSAASASSTTAKRKFIASGRLIDIYAVECKLCSKWRKIDTQEEYEEIRSRQREDPFVCNKKEGVSCKDAADLNYDSSRTWVIDKPGLPKTPRGFKRSLILRKDYSKMDAYYITPTGKRLKSRNEIAAFIEANQDYSYAPLEDFNFTVPKVMEDTIPSTTVHGGLTIRSRPRTISHPRKIIN
ncbi:PREDICTED: methyl-CpG-binding domain-containing protein 1 [Camelina sativa]|uniref:Methyl-CpG-binding domain-containing protein 1 n=1 Tax=Camelina sativa TaxID=90675 RepID=A0ABM0UCV3_CAMSA|nr:PREDICTED: methyl-CpG-binding domain-containing protein 1 [Camelina sativa]